MTDLTALLGSRICHDLISPLGAIGNGVELMMMTPGHSGPELTLIAESVTNANARIRFFRIAFGAAEVGQTIPRGEVRTILDDMTRGGRLKIEWAMPDGVSRRDVKLVFLLIQCLEVALPYGGQIRIRALPGDDGWTIEAEAARMKVDPALWSRLTRLQIGEDIGADLDPAQVQFALAAIELCKRGLRISPTVTENQLTMRIEPGAAHQVATTAGRHSPPANP